VSSGTSKTLPNHGNQLVMLGNDAEAVMSEVPDDAWIDGGDGPMTAAEYWPASGGVIVE